MPDWKKIVRERLEGLKLEGSSEYEIVDELAHHLEEGYQELLLSGIPEADAERIVLEPLNAGPSVVDALRRARHRTVPEPPVRESRFGSLLYDVAILSWHTACAT